MRVTDEENASLALVDAEIKVVLAEVTEILANCILAQRLGEDGAEIIAINQAQEFLWQHLDAWRVNRAIFMLLWPDAREIASRIMTDMPRADQP